jgi:hypothetical protein
MKKKDAKLNMLVVMLTQPDWGICFIQDFPDKRNAVVEELFGKKHHHYAPFGRLKPLDVKEGEDLLLIDCPICGIRDAPLSFKATMAKGDKSIDIYECAYCGKVPNLGVDIKIKGRIRREDLLTVPKS